MPVAHARLRDYSCRAEDVGPPGPYLPASASRRHSSRLPVGQSEMPAHLEAMVAGEAIGIQVVAHGLQIPKAQESHRIRPALLRVRRIDHELGSQPVL